METFDRYLYKTVRIQTKDGRILEGLVRSFESAVSSSSGYPELDIEYPWHIEVVDQSEIESIEILT